MKKAISSNILRWAKRIKCINLLGGKCKLCGDNNIFHLVFHHVDSDTKEYTLNELKNYRWSIIDKELKKCILLCANCHKDFHFNRDYIECNSRDTINRRQLKMLFLNYKNAKCEKCNYNKNIQALVFHHKYDKNFEFSGFRGVIDMNNLDFNIKKELDSCILLCNNCHTEEHCDIDFFENYKNEIYEKVKNYCEKQKKLPINDIINLYKSGVKQNEIAKKYNASKGTICDIIKKYNIK